MWDENVTEKQARKETRLKFYEVMAVFTHIYMKVKLGYVLVKFKK
jgi:hypothetical protein